LRQHRMNQHGGFVDSNRYRSHLEPWRRLARSTAFAQHMRKAKLDGARLCARISQSEPDRVLIENLTVAWVSICCYQRRKEYWMRTYRWYLSLITNLYQVAYSMINYYTAWSSHFILACIHIYIDYSWKFWCGLKICLVLYMDTCIHG
jgi:hypothetical protein